MFKHTRTTQVRLIFAIWNHFSQLGPSHSPLVTNVCLGCIFKRTVEMHWWYVLHNHRMEYYTALWLRRGTVRITRATVGLSSSPYRVRLDLLSMTVIKLLLANKAALRKVPYAAGRKHRFCLNKDLWNFILTGLVRYHKSDDNISKSLLFAWGVIRHNITWHVVLALCISRIAHSNYRSSLKKCHILTI